MRFFFDLYHYPLPPRCWRSLYAKSLAPRKTFFWVSLQQGCISCSADTLRRGSDRNRAEARLYWKRKTLHELWNIESFSRHTGDRFYRNSSTVRENRIDFHSRVTFWIKNWILPSSRRIFIRPIFPWTLILTLVDRFFLSSDNFGGVFFFSSYSNYDSKKKKKKEKITFVLLLG